MSEVKRLQAKKKQIHDELYDKVKMEMFKASSKLEGIDYEDMKKMTDLNEMAEEAKRKKALDGLAELSQEMEKNRKVYERDNDTWWNGLSEQEREDAFYAVVKRIHKAEIEDRGTYRYALYDVFGFDPGMYARGMDCGYMNLHNSIFDSNKLSVMKRVNRLEVIDDTGRLTVKYLKDDERVRYELQDDDRTLKVFIDKVTKVDT